MSNTSSRKRATKAALAALLGLALLTGVGGTFANWYTSANVPASTINAGHLNWTVGTGSWTDVNKSTAIDPATFVMVPGDKVAYTTTIETDALGTNLKANLNAVVPTKSGTMASFAVVSTELYDGATAHTMPFQVVTGAKHTYTVKVTVELPFTTGDSNGTDAEDTTLDLAATTVSLTQVA